MLLRQIFDPPLAQYAYLVGCQRSGEALIIDPERDIDRYWELAAENGLRIKAVAETHIHADFVSGGREFAQDPNVHLYLSAEGGPDWTYRWPAERPRRISSSMAIISWSAIFGSRRSTPLAIRRNI